MKHEDRLRHLENEIVMLDIREVARLVARHALMCGDAEYGAELRALVVLEMVRQGGSVMLTAARYGLARNSVYKLLREARKAKKVKK